MYKKFFVDVCEKTNLENIYNLTFDVYNTDIAQKWANEVAKNYELFETERFKSWKVDRKQEQELVDNLNAQIRILNSYFNNLIAIRCKLNTSQETLNYLHKIFEDLRGKIDQGTEKFNNSPKHIQEAIQNLNILVHRYEDYNTSKPSKLAPDHPFASIVGTFKNRPRFSLSNADYDHFTFNWKFGEVYINYCEVGKPILDVFKDQDDHVGEDNIRPLHYYSADFMIKFGPDTPKWFYKKRLENLKQWLIKKGYNYKDKKLSLGLIPVAKINLKHSGLESINAPQIVKKLAKYQKLKNVKIT